MSDLGVPPAPPPSPQPNGRASSDVPAWVLYVAAGLALSLAALLFYVVFTQSDGPNTEQPDAHVSAPSYPAHWDHRIAPIAKIASRLRGLQFHHPVPVRFLSPARFEKSLLADQRKLSASDKADIRHETGLLRALGLISGNVDLVKAEQGYTGGATLAYYSFKDKSITVRGTKVTPAVRATLVHELTHVLQDQDLHAGAMTRRLQHESKKGSSTSASELLRAVVEGDAERVELKYADSLNPQRRRALDAAQKAEDAQGHQRLAKIPPVLVTLGSAPYALGEGLVLTVATTGGNAAVDRLFRHPPLHDSALFDPIRFVQGGRGATKVALPELKAGEKQFDSGEFGELALYLMLAERLPMAQALTTVDGWGGDAYVGFVRNGTSCARAVFAGRTPEDTSRIESSLQTWAASAPQSPTSVSLVGGRVSFESCDPGTAVQSGQDDSETALSLVGTRDGIGAGLIRSGAPLAVARCVAARLVQTYTASQLVDPNFGKGDPAVLAQVQQLAAGCR